MTSITFSILISRQNDATEGSFLHRSPLSVSYDLVLSLRFLPPVAGRLSPTSRADLGIVYPLAGKHEPFEAIDDTTRFQAFQG